MSQWARRRSNDTEALKRRARAVSGEAKRDERADFLSAAGITKGRSGKGGLYPTAAPKKRERFSPAAGMMPRFWVEETESAHKPPAL